MYLRLHTVDELNDESRGKTHEVYGVPKFRKVVLQNGNPGIHIQLSCSEHIGTGERNVFANRKIIRRDAEFDLTEEDVAAFIRAITGWEGLKLNGEDALRLIVKLSTDMLGVCE